jgi:hypothetical protein
MSTENSEEGKMVRVIPPKPIITAVSILAISGALLLLAMAISELKGFAFIGHGDEIKATISVSGDGKAFAAPDISTVSFSVASEALKAADARKQTDDKVKAILAFIKESGVVDKDIKTTGYSLYPKYEWRETRIVCITYPCPQPPGKQVLLGYEVSQTIEVKIRKIDDTGTIVGGIGDKGATNMDGPQFTVENPDAVKAEARKEAITKAQAKAQLLAEDLGVTLVRIVSFSEDGNNIAYGRGGAEKAMAFDMMAQAAPAEVPVGENTFASNVTIVYEIR